jgi:hypothetical protein
MIHSPVHQANEATYQRLRATIDQTYPRGRFIAIGEDRVLADAATAAELLDALRAQGKDPMTTLVVQAGDELPDFVYILTGSAAR